MRAKEFISELNMSPGNLLKFLDSPVVAKMRAGFEAELCIPGEYDESNADGELDLDEDRTLERNIDFDDLRNFFNISARDHRSLNDLENGYSDWVNDAASAYIRDNLDERAEYLKDQDPDLSDDDAEEKAHEELQDEYYRSDVPDLYDYFKDIGYSSYYDIYVDHTHNFDWPYYKSSNSFKEAVEYYSYELREVVKTNVEILDDYHDMDKNSEDWYLEPDPSINPKKDGYMGMELVSPPMPVKEMLTKMNKVFDWAKGSNAFTNKSTGLHVGVSIEGATTADIDYVKLALFLGDQYILQRFGREANKYAEGAAEIIRRQVDLKQPFEIVAHLEMLKRGMSDVVSKAIFQQNSTKYVSINMRSNYIEFRSMGDDYLSHPEVVQNTVLRYVRAYALAADPMAERQEYFKKLSKLLNPGASDKLAPFVNYAMGNIDKSDLISALAVRKRMKQPPAQPNATQQPQANTPINDFGFPKPPAEPQQP